MKWSRLRAELRSRMTPSLRARVDFHLTNYRHFGSQGHEVWVTLDGARIFSASYGKRMVAENYVSQKFGLNPSDFDGPDGKRSDDLLVSHNILSAADTVASFRTFLDLDPQLALTSSDPILRALALLDRRIGTRTLLLVDLSPDEHPLVKALYELRMSTLSRPPQACSSPAFPH